MVVTPPPSTGKEANHIYNNFKTIGNLEYFKVDRDGSRVNIYGQGVTAVFNPSSKSLINSVLYEDDLIGLESEKQLQDEKERLTHKLYSLLALPRYSFIEGDEKFYNREVEIPFKHQLTDQGRKYQDLYSMKSATVDSQFIYIDINDENKKTFDNFNNFKTTIRFNFQKFHKFDRLSLKTGIDGINNIIGTDKFKPTSLSMTVDELANLNDI